jgi:dihydropteroate synthase
VEHNPRIIEMGVLPDALRGMSDLDDRQAASAERLVGRSLRAVRLDAVDAKDAAPLKVEAQALELTVLAPGSAPPGSPAPRIVVGEGDRLERLGPRLEARGARALGAAIRQVLAAYERTGFGIAFADGARMDLGSETRVMGVLNVTPDSFSDGASLPTTAKALEAAARMADHGADLIDIGGESTRPGAAPVPEGEEVRRVVPVIRAIKRRVSVRVSIDTAKAGVARVALEAGADLVNDISALSDPGMIAVLRDTRTPVVVTHMRGTPRTMQQDTAYVDLLSSVVGFLRKCVERAASAGIADDKILIDPGLGFGKSAAGNLRILRELPTLRSVGRPIVIGASRKSFIGSALDLPVHDRLEGSMAVAAFAAWQGAHVIRAHDVAATKRTTRMIDAIRKG